MIGIEFLFGPEVASIVERIRNDARDVGAHSDELKDMPVGADRTAKVAEKRAALNALEKHFSQLETIFRPYLDFAKLRG
jgi:hypothetical protein